MDDWRHDPPDQLGRSEAENLGLIRQAQLYNPLTRRLLVDAGVGSGMRVLDVGSGAGDVALLLAELVGPTGSVVGIDLDGAILAVARRRVRVTGWSNVTFVEGDIRSATLDGPFDAAVGRFVMPHVADPVPVLRACRDHLRPGGLVVFQEHDSATNLAAVPPSALIARMRGWSARFREQASPVGQPDLEIGYHLFAAYIEAGLPAPQMRYEAPIGGGAEWAGYHDAAERFRPRAAQYVQTGVVTEAEIDIETVEARLRAEIVGLRGVLRSVPAIGLWARTPRAN